MGDIGHHTLLYDLKRWQVRAAIRGQNRKNRTAWEVCRLTTFTLAKTMGGVKDTSLHEFMPLSWDITTSHTPSDDDIQGALDLIREENERLQRERKCTDA